MYYRVFRGERAVRKRAGSEQCEGKKKYRLKEARQTANSLRRMGRFKQARIYECGCGFWHIARQR